MSAVDIDPAREALFDHRRVTVARVVATQHGQMNPLTRRQIDASLEPSKEERRTGPAIERSVVTGTLVDLVVAQTQHRTHPAGDGLLQFKPLMRHEVRLAGVARAEQSERQLSGFSGLEQIGN